MIPDQNTINATTEQLHKYQAED